MPLDEHWGLSGLGAAGSKIHCPDCVLGILLLCLPCEEFTSLLKTLGIPLPGTSLILKIFILLSQYRGSCPVDLYIL